MHWTTSFCPFTIEAERLFFCCISASFRVSALSETHHLPLDRARKAFILVIFPTDSLVDLVITGRQKPTKFLDFCVDKLPAALLNLVVAFATTLFLVRVIKRRGR